MTDSQRTILERNDLLLMHTFFDQDMELDDSDLMETDFESVSEMDLWSKALYAIEDSDEKQIRKIKNEIENSDFSPEMKLWWKQMFSIALDEPAGELKTLYKQNMRVPEECDAKAFEVSGNLILKAEIISKQVEKRKLHKEEDRGE